MRRGEESKVELSTVELSTVELNTRVNKEL